MKKNITALLFIFLLLVAKESRAQTQQIKFNLIKGSNGVSLGKINCIMQDNHGFIWLSDQTNRCIVRYDGNTMTRYQNDPKNPNSLGGYYPECIAADKEGNIWIGFYGMGLDKFNPETKIFTHYRRNLKNPNGIGSDTISCIKTDHLGNIWIGTNEGIELVDTKTGSFKHYRHNEKDAGSLSYNLVRTIYEDHAGELWVGTGLSFNRDSNGGLNRLNRSNGTFTRYMSDSLNPQTLINNKVRSIFEDSKGNFWIGTAGDGLHTMDRKTGIFTRYRYNPRHPELLSRPPVNDWSDHITFITEDVEKQIWIGTMFSGINRYNPVTKRITHYGLNGKNNGAFTDNSGWYAYAAPDGHLWVTTQSANLFKIDFYNISIPHHGSNFLDGVYSYFEESGNNVFWLGASGGPVRKDLKKGTTEKIELNNDVTINPWDKIVNTFLQDSLGNLWMATGSGLYKYNLQTKQIAQYKNNPADSTSIADNKIYSLFKDKASNLWVGAVRGGINYMDTKTGKFIHYKNNPADTSSISGDVISILHEDETGDLWIGCYQNNGLNRLNVQTKKFRHYLPGISIFDIYTDATGVVWVATGSGLYRYNRQSDNFNLLGDESIALQTTSIYSITSDNQNNLWIGSSDGIYKLNPKRNHLQLYGPQNGVEGQNLNERAAYRKQDGEIYFGDIYGYFSFKPDSLKAAPNKPQLYFSGFWLTNEAIKLSNDGPLKQSLFNKTEIKLAHNQNVFSFSFSTIDFRNTGNQRFYYQLENFDNDWRQSGPEERIQYFKVPPGKYIFRVKTADSNTGEILEKNIVVIISKPWWSTWWAYCIYALLLASLAFALHRYQRGRVIKAERERTRTKELAQAKEIEKAYHELRRTQAQLIQSEKMASLGELTAGIAHEIQNPLNFVNNFSDVSNELLDELMEEITKGNFEEVKEILNDVKQNLEKINHHGKRADAIVKGMLQHSRSSSGVKEPTDINALCDEYLRLCYHGLRAKDKSFNVTMKTDFDGSIGNINIIPQDIGRVLLNLINNAFYAAPLLPEGGSKDPAYKHEPTVWVTTSQNPPPAGGGGGAEVLISVRDNGPGIPQKILDKIFQPFFTTKPTGQGTGLGLSLSYDIVKAHGGELKVETKEGEFAEFIVHLPDIN